MAYDHISSIEVSSIVFLIIFIVLLFPSLFVWYQYIRAGYAFRYGFWGAFILCASRIAAFTAELVFYTSGYTNINAAIAYIVCLAIGYIGLLETFSAVFVTWAETHDVLSETQQRIHGKVRLLNIAAMVLLIYGSTRYNDRGGLDGNGEACIQAGTIILLVLTVVQTIYLVWGWGRYSEFSQTLAVLAVALAALYVRIIYGVFVTFHPDHSMIRFDDSNVKYLAGAILVPETVALILLIGIGFHNVRGSEAGLPVREKRGRVAETDREDTMVSGKRPPSSSQSTSRKPNRAHHKSRRNEYDISSVERQSRRSKNRKSRV